MKRILLLLIATSSCASLMGMHEQTLLPPPPYTAPTSQPPYVPAFAHVPNLQYLPQVFDAATLAHESTEHQGAYPCCERTLGEVGCIEQTCCCILPILTCAVGTVVDLASIPCVCYNRTRDPQSSAGRNHFCYFSRQWFAEFVGIRAIHIQGLNSAYPSYLMRCKIPDWDSTDIDTH